MRHSEKIILFVISAVAFCFNTMLNSALASRAFDESESISVNNATTRTYASNSEVPSKYVKEVELYFLNTEYEEYISMPDTYAQSYQIQLDGNYKNVTYSSSNESIAVSDSGMVTLEMESIITVGTAARKSFLRTYCDVGDKGTADITVTADGHTFVYKVDAISYGAFYRDQIVQEYLDSHIKPGMSDMEKLKALCEYICSFDYKADTWFGTIDALVYENGCDCIGSTYALIYLCNKVGLHSWARDAQNDPGAGNNHHNNIVRLSDNSTYIVDCGYSGTAPRTYSIKETAIGSATDDFICTQNDDGTLQIKQYLGTSETVIIPYEIDGKTVTSIGSGVFAEHTEIQSVIMPDTITHIGSECFYGCTSLLNIDFSKELYRIDIMALENTAWLDAQPDESPVYAANVLYCYKGTNPPETIAIKSGTIGIAASAFAEEFSNANPICIHRHCEHVKHIELPDGLKYIGSEAFYNCLDLESVTIPESLEALGSYAFEKCRSLSIISLPENTNSIGMSAFLGCTSLKSISLPSKVNEMGEAVFLDCSSLKSVVLPEGTKSLEINGNVGGMFTGCSSLESVSIPSTVTYMQLDGYQFSGCVNLKEINVSERNSYFTSVDGVLFNAGMTKLIKYPSGKKAKSYSVPSSVTTVSTCAFEYADVPSINLPDNVTKIAAWAFKYSNIENIVIPAKVDSIDVTSFWYCNALKEFKVDINNTDYTAIDGVLFTSDKALLCVYPNGKTKTHYSIPEGTVEIAVHAFEDNNILETISFPDTVEKINEKAFRNCEKLRYVVLPEGLKNILAYAFEGCNNLDFVILPSTLQSVGADSFECKNLKSVYYNGTLDEWEAVKYTGASNIISSGSMDGGSTNKETWVFSYSGLYTIYAKCLPLSWQFDSKTETVKCSGNIEGTCGENMKCSYDYSTRTLHITGSGKIDEVNLDYSGWKNGNQAIEQIIIENEATAIGSKAFYGFHNLEGISLPEGILTIDTSAFQYCGKLKDVLLPESLTRIDSRAFGNCKSLSSITIPKNVTRIGYNTFDMISTDAIIVFENPNTYIPMENDTICSSGTMSEHGGMYIGTEKFDGIIYGYANSTAKSYAAEFGCRFSPIDAESMVEGDINLDGECDVADVILLQKWLLAVPNTHLPYWQAADLCKDGKLNVFDLFLMKRMLLVNQSN